jgi:hypothetical protein
MVMKPLYPCQCLEAGVRTPIQVPGWAGRGEGKGREGEREEREEREVRGVRKGSGQKFLFVP